MTTHMQVLNVPDDDGRIVVVATLEAISEMVAERYKTNTKKDLPANWKLKIIMTDKSSVLIGNKEIKG